MEPDVPAGVAPAFSTWWAFCINVVREELTDSEAVNGVEDSPVKLSWEIFWEVRKAWKFLAKLVGSRGTFWEDSRYCSGEKV